MALQPNKRLELIAAGVAHVSEDGVRRKIDTTEGAGLPF
jgi:hypothetical protein